MKATTKKPAKAKKATVKKVPKPKPAKKEKAPKKPTAQNNRIAKIGLAYNEAFYNALAGKKLTAKEIATARAKAKIEAKRVKIATKKK